MGSSPTLAALFSFSMEKECQVSGNTLFIYVGLRFFMMLECNLIKLVDRVLLFV